MMMRRAARPALGLLLVVGLLVVGTTSGRLTPPSTPARAAVTDTVPLFPGCNNVALTWSAGTSLDTVAQGVTPAGALESIFRYDNTQQRYFGYSPLPAAREAGANDYTAIIRALEPVFVCMNEAGELNRPDA
jgi:hypothetical protein